MADVKPLYEPSASLIQSYSDKYVVVYDFSEVDTPTASREIDQLLRDLEAAGLHTEVRAGYDQTILVFVKAPSDVLGSAVYKSRVKDWLYGVTPRHPGGSKDTTVRGDFEAEELLCVYHLVSWPKSLGGAGITPGWGQWEHIQSVFPLHNEAANAALLKRLSTRLFLSDDDLDQIRNLFGSKVAFYFAFIQTYLVFLSFPVASGLLTWWVGSVYSLTYAILTCVWCTCMLEYWRIRQTDLSIRWKVKSVSGVKANRPQYRWDKAIVDDTGRTQHYFPRWKRALRLTLQIPFMLVCAAALGVIIVAVFALEILISETYDGAYKTAVEYIPTVMLALALPRISSLLENVGESLTEFENHRTADSFEMSLTLKTFVLSIITDYLPIFITAFVYVPFGADVVPWLSDRTRQLLGPFGARYLSGAGDSLDLDSSRLRDEVIALAITGQISSFLEENVLPVAKRKFHEWYRDQKSVPALFSREKHTALTSVVDDDPREAEFLRSVRGQATLEPYNVQEDIAEIVLQFGHLALFSPVWPLVSIGFLINNIIELRTDFVKITREHQRPAPVRSDGIGPWLDSLNFLTWAGSISTGAIVHIFGSQSIGAGAWWALPITIFISEHVFTALRALVRAMLANLGSEYIRRERNELYTVRMGYLEQIEADKQAGASLTVDQRHRWRSSRAEGGDAFFTKQMEEGGSAKVGVGLIRACREAAAVAGEKIHFE